MESVKVSRTVLINRIAANRAKHIATYERAMQGWKLKLIETYMKALKQARSGKEPRFLHPGKPQTYLSHYDRVLGMLRMSREAEVTLTAEDYDRYISDQWEWSNAFSNSTVGYAKVAKFAGGARRK